MTELAGNTNNDASAPVDGAPATHPLSAPWSFYSARSKQPNEYLGDIESIEQALTIFNALPPFTTLEHKQSLYFTRNKIKPVFEEFKKGMRVTIDCISDSLAKAALLRVLVATMGEHLGSVLDGTDDKQEGKTEEREPQESSSTGPISVVRVTLRPSQEYRALSRIECWWETQGQEADDKVVKYFKDHLPFISKEKNFNKESLTY